jgi:hypothetical protein
LLIAKAVSGAVLSAAVVGGWWSSHAATVKPANPPVVTITSRDYSYDPIADIPAGVVDLRLHNLGPDFHHASIFKLAPGRTAEQFIAALKSPGPPPMWATPAPGPNAAPVGESSNSIAELTPGNYVVMCFIDTNGGVPHFMKGMFRAFRVVPSANTGRAPKADMNLNLFDYGFKFAGPVTAGSHIIRISNTSMQAHEIELFMLDDGKTAKDLHGWLFGPMNTKPPASAVGGVTNVPPGAHPEFRVTLMPGHYVANCFIPDAKDGKPHILHGMEYAFEVK